MLLTKKSKSNQLEQFPKTNFILLKSFIKTSNNGIQLLIKTEYSFQFN